ncbi:MAG: hypothetical protein IJN61_05445 [Clostridia bacterium]|nr:hypothetical protein [Clostridia bacterium]MBQ7038532.1 hypothetical protein [Clostridia bacterium]
MFGYVKVYQPELKMGEFEQYRGIYCSLCKTLGKRYGFTAQMTLSYDMTFLVVLHMALMEECTGFKKGRCPYNPIKKRTCCNHNAALDFCADAAMLLAYHKTEDTLADDHFFKQLTARMLLPIMRRNRRRAAKRLPELDQLIEREMLRQNELEESGIASVDLAAEPTAEMLSALCSEAANDEKQKRVLSRFGYCLGRVVYLMDAADDLEDDLKNRSYNPIALSMGLNTVDMEKIKSARESAGWMLNTSIAECKAAYELLNVRRFDGILRNVLEWGIPGMQKLVLSGERKKRPSRRSGGFNDAKSV